MKRFLTFYLSLIVFVLFVASCDSNYAVEHTHIYDQKNLEEKYLQHEADCKNAATYYYSCSCGEKNSDIFTNGETANHLYDQIKTEIEYLKSEATCENAAVYYYSCECGAKSTDTFTSGEKAEHIFDKKEASSEYLKDNATCVASAVYYYSCECGAKSTDTFTSGEKAEHIFDKKVVLNAYLKSEANYTSPAIYYYSCECGEKSTETFTNGEKLTPVPAPITPTPTPTIPTTPTQHVHIYNQKITETAYLKSEASCSSAAVYYYSCLCSQKGSETFVHGSPKPHTYNETVIAATCKEQGYTLYSCICNHSYKDNFKAKLWDHIFELGRVEKEGVSFETYLCKKCSLEAVSFGNADGSISGGNNKVKYYVTGDKLNDKDYEVVIYGTGDMPDFAKDNQPMWYKYLFNAKKIVIAEGITSIGAYAFYDSNSNAKVEYSISDTVKVIKPYALGLKTNSIVLGKSVTRIESNGILYENVSSNVYVPKTVTYMGDISANVTYFYEGTLDELYAVSTHMRIESVTLEKFFAEWDDIQQNYFQFYLNAQNINDRSHYWK